MGPGSAAHHFVLRSVRGTSVELISHSCPNRTRIFPFSRHIVPELCGIRRPRKCRGRREDRVPAGHPRSTVRKVATKIAQRHTGEAKHPAFPAQWFDGLCRALPGERCTIAPVALPIADLRARLGAAHHDKTWRTDPGRQDHTILPYAGLYRSCARGVLLTAKAALQTTIAPALPASTTSHPACRDDRDTPLGPGWDGRNMR